MKINRKQALFRLLFVLTLAGLWVLTKVYPDPLAEGMIISCSIFIGLVGVIRFILFGLI